MLSTDVCNWHSLSLKITRGKRKYPRSPKERVKLTSIATSVVSMGCYYGLNVQGKQTANWQLSRPKSSSVAIKRSLGWTFKEFVMWKAAFLMYVLDILDQLLTSWLSALSVLNTSWKSPDFSNQASVSLVTMLISIQITWLLFTKLSFQERKMTI